MVLNPQSNDIYAVETDLMDDKGTIGIAGLFIPEQWSMPPYIDKYDIHRLKKHYKLLKMREHSGKKI